jgi:hypothetical protein
LGWPASGGWLPLAQYVFGGGAQAGKVFLHNIKKQIFSNGIVFMPQYGSEGPDLPPRLTRHQNRGQFTKFRGCLADPFQTPLNRITGSSVFLEGCRSMFSV